ncbi:MAG TPA: amidophosphoribosyltransferase [Phycisphaerae bacterium]|nr:amidophosphoribosyltransferase [Phycisphaerae bacterium]HOB75187.1 amidophosphoribosyltransferase [Phycisphaerae bacterium]HOJ54668.1 amidophosphoribosyltransferase [Phycisphaerae bacterium]HOL25982.1 amidophosphoribosyltransferase [Phycisphaerae bacterium]HPP19446.1 amidophosphoribosyltransferase [Phycisphaerae bacterium]
MGSASVKHYCGLFGIYGHPDAVNLTYLGLFAQQHRGQESAGIVSRNSGPMRRYAGMGLVTEVFNPQVLKELRAPVAIGHVRYSTTGSCSSTNAQPLLVSYARGQVAVAHNGNLINAGLLRREYEAHGAIFNTTSDTEVIVHLLAKPSHLEKDDHIAHVLRHLQGAYSLLFLFPDRMVAARDPFGLRPLVLGRMDNGAVVVASETCAFDIIDAEFVREVEPGEIVSISPDGIHSSRIVPREAFKPAHCIFEQIYFASPASNVFGQNVHQVRKAMGAQLAREAPVDADIVVPVPNCARCAAIGYAQTSGIPYERGFTTSHYAGRSFIMPDQNMRDLAVRVKLNVIKENVAGRRLVVVEDSVVRGTTTRGKIGALRKAGAKEIHLRVASPPIRHGCYFGIDFPDPDELIANKRTVEEIRDYLGVDSLHYLSHEGMLSCVKRPPDHYCTACFSGRYPMPVDQPISKFALEHDQLRMFE